MQRPPAGEDSKPRRESLGAELAAETLRPGTVVGGRFRVEHRLGEGGMGAVFRATRLDSLGETVALKVLTRPDVVDRFENEARLLLSLRGPHVLRLIELGRTEESWPFLVTEYLEGRTLQAALEAGDLSNRSILRILKEIAEALEEAHGLGIVHRDLKPPNVFLERMGNREHVKVLDFGIAKFVGEGAASPRYPPMALAGGPTTGVIGSPPFMAPEQCRGEPVSERTDLFALGLIAHLALSGRPAYDYPNHHPAAILGAHASGTPRALTLDRYGNSLDARVRRLVDGLLETRPERRLGPASAVVRALDELLDGPPARPPVRASRSALWRLAPAWVPALTAAVVIAGMVGLSPSSPLSENDMPPGLIEHGPHAPAVPAEPSTRSAEAVIRTQPSRMPAAPTTERAATKKRPAQRPHLRIFGYEDLVGTRSAGEVRALIAPIAKRLSQCGARHVGASEVAEIRLRGSRGGVRARVTGTRSESALLDCLEPHLARLPWPAEPLTYVRCRISRSAE